jgi:predicted ATPase
MRRSENDTCTRTSTEKMMAASPEAPHFMNALTPMMEEMKISDVRITATGLLLLGDPPKETAGDTKAVEAVDTTAWRRNLQEKVYERHQEQALLNRYFQVTQKKHDTAMFLLISGSCGTGKTRLAETLKEPVEKQGGYFLTGKFDQLCRPEPYTAFCMAFTEFADLVVERGGHAIATVSKAIHEAIGNEVSVLTSMIPSLERIVGRSNSSASKAKAGDAIQRFVFVFRMFMRTVCSPQQPMVLLVDDLHWADPCSLDLLMSLVTDTKNEGLVLVGTCRDNIAQSSYLSSRLRAMEDKDHVEITNISLKNLTKASVGSVLTGVLSLREEQSVALSEIVFRQTQGNIFDVIEFLRWLQDADLLHYDRDLASWRWDDEEISLTINICKVGDFQVDKLDQLSQDMKEVLKVAACLGSHVDGELIEYLLKKPVGDILNEAAAKGILKLNESRGSYLFEHDDRQEGAYHLIPVNELGLFHLEIGRRLWPGFDTDELDQNIFVRLSQMNVGRRQLTREKEKIDVATFCLHAGKKAAESSTFRTASIYLNLGIELLGSRSWRDDYDLTLALHNAAAEMEMCTANFERMEKLLEKVFLHALNSEDSIQAYATRIYALGASDRAPEAIDTGIEVLKGLGEKFPSRYSKAHLISEMRTVKRLLKGKSDEQLLRLPHVENKEKLAALRILQQINIYALLVRPQFAPFITLRSLKLTLQYGLSVFASSAFASYGILLIGALNEISEAFHYGELRYVASAFEGMRSSFRSQTLSSFDDSHDQCAYNLRWHSSHQCTFAFFYECVPSLVLLERFEAMEFLPRVYVAVYGCIYPWKKPIRETLEPLLRAYRVGMQTGDFKGACLSANLYCCNAMDAGISLDVIEREWRGFQEVMQSNGQKAEARMAMPPFQCVHHFMGLSEDPLSGKGDLIDFDQLMQKAIEHKRGAHIVRLSNCRMMLAYFFNDYDLAAKNLGEAKDYWQLPPTFGRANYFFCGGMVALAVAREGREIRKNLRFAQHVLKAFKGWATRKSTQTQRLFQ